MKFLLKFYSEIIVKSRPVRERFSKILDSNLRTVLRAIDPDVKLVRHWNFIRVASSTDQPEVIKQLKHALTRTPGVESVASMHEFPLGTMEEVADIAIAHYVPQLQPNSTFCVRVRRSGTHSFRSMDLERYVGHRIGKVRTDLRVNLTHPDKLINLEVEKKTLYLIDEIIPGLGGFPLGTQESVLSLMSGGYDSSVASFEMIRRGIKTNYLFFNLGGTRHEAAVREVAWHLWHRYGASHRISFLTVPFEAVMGEILESVDEGYRGVVLKRMMLRAATALANRFHIDALVTGESIGQVSSQTLRNLSVIDAVTDKLVLRPLIVMDKQNIINKAKWIGTEPLTRSLPEYCGTISTRPVVDARLDRITSKEERFDFSVLDDAVAAFTELDIRELATPMTVLEDESVDVVNSVWPNDVVIDIRAPAEQEDAPLVIEGVEVLKIPFYRLAQMSKSFDAAKRHLLYCDRGTMSKIQAAQLIKRGISLAKAYHPTSTQGIKR